jgi:hypothetical protein
MHEPKDDLSRSLVTLDQHSTLIAVVELSLAWPAEWFLVSSAIH